MITLLIILALMLIFAAYILGERNGDATGYQRGLSNGNFEGRKQLAKEHADQAVEAARRPVVIDPTLKAIQDKGPRGNRRR